MTNEEMRAQLHVEVDKAMDRAQGRVAVGALLAVSHVDGADSETSHAVIVHQRSTMPLLGAVTVLEHEVMRHVAVSDRSDSEGD